MIGRPKKKELSAEERATITQASSRQTGTMSSPKSYDPNYPLFEIPVNKKVLIYIPNHTITNDEGATVLRMDKHAEHATHSGRSFMQVRCSSGVISPTLGLDGSCPLCDATSYCWDLYNKQYAEIAASRGLSVGSPDADEALKDERRNLIHDMAISRPDVYYTFPIVVIDCEEGTVKPKLDASNHVTGTPMFYTIREATYDDKWVKAFDALADAGEDVDYNPAGRWAVLNFTYNAKSGQHNKRDSARALSVTFVQKADLQAVAEYYDKLTESWTPEIAQDVLVGNALRSMDEMKDAADEIIKPTRDKLAMYELSGVGGNTVSAPSVGTSANAEAALEQFGATPAIPESSGANPPVAGEMPANVGVDA